MITGTQKTHPMPFSNQTHFVYEIDLYMMQVICIYVRVCLRNMCLFEGVSVFALLSDAIFNDTQEHVVLLSVYHRSYHHKITLIQVSNASMI